MTVEDLINYYFGVDELYNLENALEKIVETDGNISVRELLEIIRNPIQIN